MLESGIEEAMRASVGVTRGKKLLREMQAQKTAGEAALRLEDALANKPVGAAQLKVG